MSSYLQRLSSHAKSVAGHALSRTISHLTTRDIVDPGPAPDGGVKAWTQVFFAWIVCFTTWGYINSFGAFQTYYTSTLGVSQSTVSWVGSILLFIVFFCSVFTGRALDAGLFLPTFAIGSVIQLIGIFTNSLCTNVWQLILAQGVCTGLGSGIIFCPTTALVTTYFQRNRALAVAIMSSGNSAGGAIYPVIVRSLLPKIGFGWTIRVLGFVNMVCLIASIIFLRPRLPPRKQGPIVEWAAFKEAPYTLMVIGMSFVFGGLFFSFYYIGSYGRTIIGMSYTESTTLVILFNAVGIPVRLVTGHLVDTLVGPLNGMIPLLFINGIFAFAWTGVKTRVGLYVFVAFYGMSAGAFQCLFPTTLTSLNKDLSKNGVRLGMAFSVFSIAGLIGPPIGGALLQTNGGGRGGYLVAQLALGCSTMFGSCLMVAARVCKEGWSLNRC
ncbi:MFS transporter, MCP family, solute carrier family 16, member 10 [Rhizodiscina lignyota]|uniref:MFS transporter, MCP family, solute carrier family 16, member 10 n=1 Tax=Rhizodiscina lignyota TaxID=1504668 RepID=A0A9P4IRZ6_9PEZI|nr:MFS transporter, MCP family, solute carrier family 16, member 10 [Rhizodiscina lignyota]